MDALFAVFREVEVFLTGTTTPDLVPVIQYDWEAIFRRPWLPPVATGPFEARPD
jgi:hypothetical protein